MSGRALSVLRKAALNAQTWRQITSNARQAQAIRFDDHKAIFAGRPTKDLVRGLLVFRLCGISAFVNNADFLLGLGRTIIGKKATNFIVRHTFFAHFCAGEDAKEVWDSMSTLRTQGVGAILDYAAEDDAPPEGAANKEHVAQYPAALSSYDESLEPVFKAVGRVYNYQSEKLCDQHVETFLKSVDTAGSLPGQGYAAIKVTALGNPLLLQRVSTAIRTIRGLFVKFDTDGSSFLDKAEFDAAWASILTDSSDHEREEMFSILDMDAGGSIDYMEWCQQLKLEYLPMLAERIQLSGSTSQEVEELHDVCLDHEELKLLEAMLERLHIIARRAVDKNVKLMIDAEHTYFQPAIDQAVMQLMKVHNKETPIIYNTYQAYLKDAHIRLLDDMERAKREGYEFACKLVRGAYLHLERNRAEELGYPSPVWDSLEESHKCYSDCLESVLAQVQVGKTEILLGTHNQDSIEQAVRRMGELGINPTDNKVSFGQLLGMADHLTFTLGGHGYPAYKYVPYGQVDEVIPYLLRRASENAAILEGTKQDVALHQKELKRRLFGL